VLITLQNVYRVYEDTREDIYKTMCDLYGYWKTTSILFLYNNGFPMADMLIITNWDNDTMNEIVRFSEFIEDTSFIFRHDKAPESLEYPRGGFSLSTNECESIIGDYLRMNRIVILLKNSSYFDNGYNINVMYDGEKYFLEILGPGFDASDLQRGDLTPHESIVINNRKIISKNVISQEEYKNTVNIRLDKIKGRLLTKGLVRNASGRDEILGFLGNNTQSRLPNNLISYVQIDDSKIQEIMSLLYGFDCELQSGYFFYEVPYVISFSYLAGEKLNAWDIVFPSKKYGNLQALDV